MTLERLRGQWERLGRRDPLWAVLTLPGKRGGRWDAEEFFATGRRSVDEDLAWLDALGLAVRRGRALDFGCGAGRLTQALAERFESVCGVDVSAAMVDVARRHNRHPDTCAFLHNSSETLAQLGDGTFDLVMTHLVLQHVPPRLAFGYVAELVRVLAPGGVLLLGLTSEPRRTVAGTLMRIVPAPLANAARRALLGFEMHGTPRDVVEGRLAMLGARVAGCREGETGHWVYCTYAVVRGDARGRPGPSRA